MNTKAIAILVLLFPVVSLKSSGEDTLSVHNNFNYKLGVKLISEQSLDERVINGYENRNVWYGGLQVIRKISESKCSLESGIYLSSKLKDYAAYYHSSFSYPNGLYVPYTVKYHYLSIPVNFRVDTRLVYVSGGCFIDYLLYHSTDHEYYIDSTENFGTDRKVSLGYNFTLGLEKSFSSSMSVFAEVRFLYTLSQPKTDGNFFLNHGTLAPTNSNYGIAFGVNYKLFRKFPG